MKVTVIDGSLKDYVNRYEVGAVCFSEDCTDASIELASIFLNYGKTVMIEPENEGD